MLPQLQLQIQRVSQSPLESQLQALTTAKAEFAQKTAALSEQPAPAEAEEEEEEDEEEGDMPRIDELTEEVSKPEIGPNAAAEAKEKARVAMQAHMATGPNGEEMPVNVHLIDSNLLEVVELEQTDGYETKCLAAEEHALVLALLENIHKCVPDAELVREEMTPYFECVLNDLPACSWAIRAVALMHRSFHERARPKTVERCLLQLESLHVHYVEDGFDYQAAGRVRDLWLTSYPPAWKLQRVLAEGYLQMGIARSALDIYTRIHDLSAIVTCLIGLDKRPTAEQMIREKLETDPTPELWCLLGETTANPEYFETGWQLSNQRHAKCSRLLGMAHFVQKDFPAAVESLQVRSRPC